MSVLDKPQLATVAIGKGLKRIRRLFSSASTSLTGLSSLVPERIAKAPPDLRTADTMLAQEYYNGRFIFGGKLVETNGKSPFTIGSQGEAWDRELHSFEWLRHLSASDDILTANHARTLISDWIELYMKVSDNTVWNIEVSSKRLISWLCNSIMIVSNSDHEFHELFMRILGNHVRFLKREISTAPEGLPRLYAAIALAYASVCHENEGNLIKLAGEKLAHELSIQILPDGGHSSRNPACIVDILLLLLPLKQAMEASDLAPPAEMLQAIDRLLPALRYFRMGDGNIAHFNGAGHVDRDFIATLMRHDETAGNIIMDATHSGYQRIQQGNSILLMDVGPAPKGELSTKAHAGCLSFEFSHDTETIITNCGVPKYAESDGDAVWRSTAAHSTAVLNNTSSCKFENTSALGKYVNGQIYSAPLKPESARDDGSDYAAISAAHHGYVRDFGIRHQRNVILDQNGLRLSGNDWFSGPDKGDLRSNSKDDAAIRFHLAPGIKASVANDGQSCLLETRSGEQWAFSAPGHLVELQKSAFFAGIVDLTSIWQIVIPAKVATTPEIKWTLQKLQSA